MYQVHWTVENLNGGFNQNLNAEFDSVFEMAEFVMKLYPDVQVNDVWVERAN